MMQSFRKRNGQSSHLLPAAILVAGLLVAGAIMWAGGVSLSLDDDSQQAPTPSQTPEPTLVPIGIPPVSTSDHIKGSHDAAVIFVEYSDTECPFCKQYHSILNRIYKEYGELGVFAWVYRHLPLEQLHSRAPFEAESTECAAELGGNEGFWAYTDRLFAITPSNNGLDPDELYAIAAYVGLDGEDFAECLESRRYQDKIARDVQIGLQNGMQGTPHTVIMTPDGGMQHVPGVIEYENIKKLMDTLLDTALGAAPQAQ